jgi:ATP-dependent Clp protease, protease subunit
VSEPPEHPYIPYPFPPYRQPPERKDPLLIPVVYEPAGRDPVRRLYERLAVLLGVPLDAAAATDVAAELMSLDGRSGREIELLVNSPGGPLDDVFAVLDVIALLRAPVTVTCFGRAFGTAAIVLASGTGKRTATPNASVSLRCPPAATTVGSARDAEQLAEHERTLRERIRRILQERTRLTGSRLDNELDHGASFDSATALELGIIDEIVSRSA